MAGSKGGKQSKRKGKSIKSGTMNKETEASNSKLELEQYLYMDDNGSRDPEDKNPQPDLKFALSASRSSYTEHELVDLLHLKIELLYDKVKEELLKFGYSMATIETAIIRAGYIYGQKGLLDNILENSLAYIEKKVEPEEEVFTDIREFYECIYESMIQRVMLIQKYTQRSDAVWFLLNSNWRIFPSTTTTSHLRCADMNSISKNEEATAPNLSSDVVRNETAEPIVKQKARGKSIEVLDILSSDVLRSIAGCFSEASLRVWLQKKHDDQKIALIADLIKDIRELQEKIMEQNEQTEKRVMDSVRWLNKNLAELNRLRMETLDMEKIKKEKVYAEKYCILMLIEKEQSLRKEISKASFHTESARMLEMDAAQKRADVEAVKLGASEHEEDLREVLKREKRCMKKLAAFEKQASILHSQIKEEKERVLQLEAELLQADKEGDNVEKKWRREIRKKERLFARLPEQIRTMEIKRANSRAQLLNLQQSIEINSQLPRDDLRRLEDELTRLCISREKPDVLLDEASSSTTSGPDESSEKCIRQWTCMICLQNEVSIVFLPCKHQLVCSPCYSQSFKRVGDPCPYCSAQIEESITVYGPGL